MHLLLLMNMLVTTAETSSGLLSRGFPAACLLQQSARRAICWHQHHLDFQINSSALSSIGVGDRGYSGNEHISFLASK